MGALGTVWKGIENIERVDELALVRLPLTTNLDDNAGRGGSSETLVCNSVATVTDYQGNTISTLANEIRIVGGHRVDHGDGLDYGSGAPGIEWVKVTDPLGAEYTDDIENLCVQSEDLSTTWDTSLVTITANDAVAPDGETTADKIEQNTTFTDVAKGANITLAASTTYSVSCFAKADTAASSKLAIYDANAASEDFVTFNWTDGVPSNANSGGASNKLFDSVGDGWYRISFDFTTAGTVTTHKVYFAPEADQIDTIGCYVWGFQCTTDGLKQYVPTTTAAANAYIMGGQLIEEESENLFANPTSPATQNLTTTAQDYTVSITGTGDITLTGTATGTATEGSPLTVTATAGTLTCTVNGSVDLAQVEEKSFATSIIPIQGTRLDTDASIPFPTTLVNDFVIEFDMYGLKTGAFTVNRYLFSIGSDTNNRLYCVVSTSGTQLYLKKAVDGTTSTATVNITDISLLNSVRCEISSSTGLSISINGGTAGASSNTTDCVLVDKIVHLGQYHTGSRKTNGSISNFTISRDTSANGATPYTTRITLTDIGLNLGSEKVQITGVGGSAQYENVLFTPTWYSDDAIDIDWSEHELDAPADTWTIGGMVRLFLNDGFFANSLRTLFNPHEITTLTSTGATGEFAKENILNSNRAQTHGLTDSADDTLVATIDSNGISNAVFLIDFEGELDSEIRVQGTSPEGETVDVVYPATRPRYTLDNSPEYGYPGVNSSRYNLDDPVPHVLLYLPAIEGTVTIKTVGNDGTDSELSQLMIGQYWQPQSTCNFNAGVNTTGKIIADDSLRGDVIHRTREGLEITRNLSFSKLDEGDSAMIELMMKSDGTIVFDSYPQDREKRWRTVAVGFLEGNITLTEVYTGNEAKLKILDTKLYSSV